MWGGCACLAVRRKSSRPQSLGKEGPKDKPRPLLAQEEAKRLEIVCKQRRTSKSQGAKEGIRAWGCWRQGTGKEEQPVEDYMETVS